MVVITGVPPGRFVLVEPASSGELSLVKPMITERQLTAINAALSKEGLGGNAAEQREVRHPLDAGVRRAREHRLHPLVGPVEVLRRGGAQRKPQ